MDPMLPTVACTSAPSARLLQALAPFGLVVERGARRGGPEADPGQVACVLDQSPGSVVLITGPSGCGKSTLLRAVERAARRHGVRVVDASGLLSCAAADRPIVDLFEGALLGALRVLSAAGLSEAGLWARSAAELSEGQRARLGVALAMARAGTRSLIVIDEFCSNLDRVTARCVSRTLRRWASANGARVVCATSHDDLEGPLAPDRVICPGRGEVAA